MKKEKDEKIERIRALLEEMEPQQLDALLYRLEQGAFEYKIPEPELLYVNEDFARYEKGEGAILTAEESLRLLREKFEAKSK